MAAASKAIPIILSCRPNIDRLAPSPALPVRQPKAKRVNARAWMGPSLSLLSERRPIALAPICGDDRVHALGDHLGEWKLQPVGGG